MKNSDGQILYKVVGAQVSEFLDEYLILGIKAGTNQKMVLDTVSVKARKQKMKKLLSEIYDWANESEEGKENLNHQH